MYDDCITRYSQLYEVLKNGNNENVDHNNFNCNVKSSHYQVARFETVHCHCLGTPAVVVPEIFRQGADSYEKGAKIQNIDYI